MKGADLVREFLKHLRGLLPHLTIDLMRSFSSDEYSFDIEVRLCAAEGSAGDTKSPDILDTPDSLCTMSMEKVATSAEPYQCTQHYSVVLCDGIHIQITFHCVNTKLVFQRCLVSS